MNRTIKYLLFFISVIALSGEIKKELPSSHQRINGLILEQSSLQEVFTRFGKTNHWIREDLHHDPYYYCYKLKSKTPTWVRFGFGWAWSFKRLDSILLTNDKNDITGCYNETSVTVDKLITDGGLKLGLSNKKMLDLIGDNPEIEDNKYIFSYRSYEKYENPKKYPTSSFTYVGEWHYGIIEITITNDCINRIYIWVSGEPDW